MGQALSSMGNRKKEPDLNAHLRKTMGGGDKQTLVAEVAIVGTAQSGKSTILKQLDHLFNQRIKNNTFAQEPSMVLHDFKGKFKQLLSVAQKTSSSTNKVFESFDWIDDPVLSVSRFQQAWQSIEVQTVWKNRTMYPELSQDLGYFCAHLDRILDPDYIPTREDDLRNYKETTGLTNVKLNLKSAQLKPHLSKFTFSLFDVGGRRRERRKWIHVLNDQAAILFVISLSSFDEALVEDAHENSLDDSVSLFRGMLLLKNNHSQKFILILNKIDLFREKVNKIISKGDSFDSHFPILGLDRNYKDAERLILDHIVNRFIEGMDENMILDIFILEATDTVMCSTVFHKIVNESMLTQLSRMYNCLMTF